MDSGVAVKNFVQLYTSHQVRLHALALSMLPSHDDANDLLQETSMVLWERFGDFQAGTNFFAWAASVMRYKTMELRRKHARAGVQYNDSLLEQIEADANSLSELMADREGLLHDCIAKLGKNQVNLLQQRYENGSSIKSLAQGLGRTEGSIRQGLARIRSFLSECVSRRMGSEGLA